MLLEEIQEQNNWLFSLWRLTYRVGWERIRKAVHAAYAYFERPEILIDGETAEIGAEEEILRLDEAGSLTLRGVSTLLHAPIMITFWNQTDVVEVELPQDGASFDAADYRSVNLALCAFLDSMEIAMYC